MPVDESFNPHFYEDLGVEPTDDEATIKKAYHRLALKHHPDKNRGKEKEAEERFKVIEAAKAVLLDKEKRAEYDSQLTEYRAQQESERTRAKRPQRTPDGPKSPQQTPPIQPVTSPQGPKPNYILDPRIPGSWGLHRKSSERENDPVHSALDKQIGGRWRKAGAENLYFNLTKDQAKFVRRLKEEQARQPGGQRLSDRDLMRVAQSVMPEDPNRPNILVTDNPRVQELAERYGGETRNTQEMLQELIDQKAITPEQAERFEDQKMLRDAKKVDRVAARETARQIGKSVGMGILRGLGAGPMIDDFKRLRNWYRGMKGMHQANRQKAMDRYGQFDRAEFEASKVRADNTERQREGQGPRPPARYHMLARMSDRLAKTGAYAPKQPTGPKTPTPPQSPPKPPEKAPEVPTQQQSKAPKPVPQIEAPPTKPEKQVVQRGSFSRDR